MPKPLARFWKSLDEIPDAATSQREWCRRLKDEWEQARIFLKPLGILVKETECPAPGGDGCPRKIVQLDDGRFRAVCGNKPAHCDPVTLTSAEIACLTIDQRKLAAAVSKILSVNVETVRPRGTQVFVGSHEVAAGLKFSVVLLVPGPTTEVSVADFAEFDRPLAILVPTGASLTTEVTTAVKAAGHYVFALSEICTLDGEHRLIGIQSADVLLSVVREKLLATRKVPAAEPAWILPAGTRWENVTIEFTSKEVLRVKIRGQPTRRIESHQFGMKSKNSLKSTNAWALLRTIVEMGGDFTWHDPSKSGSIRKQKQILSQKLIKLFGIQDEPIPNGAGDSYRARFHTINSIGRSIESADELVC